MRVYNSFLRQQKSMFIVLIVVVIFLVCVVLSLEYIIYGKHGPHIPFGVRLITLGDYDSVVKDNISEWEIHGWKYVAKFDSLGPILQDDGLRVTNPKNKDSDITGFWVLPAVQPESQFPVEFPVEMQQSNNNPTTVGAPYHAESTMLAKVLPNFANKKCNDCIILDNFQNGSNYWMGIQLSVYIKGVAGLFVSCKHNFGAVNYPIIGPTRNYCEEENATCFHTEIIATPYNGPISLVMFLGRLYEPSASIVIDKISVVVGGKMEIQKYMESVRKYL